ncbi:MAG: DUF2142 domain-containing protein [Oscillospiraceae bacterium]|nr:DUF2142 domain-containing protein [Oscillospiraceae bacterium]
MGNRLKQFIKQHSRWFIALVIFLLSIAVFEFFMGATIAAAPDKLRSEYLLNPQITYELPITEEGISQIFRHEGTIYSFGIIVNSYTNTGSLKLSLYDTDRKLIVESEKELTKTTSGTMIFEFPKPIVLSKDEYLIEIIVNDNDTVVIKVGDITIGDNEKQQAIALFAEVERLSNFIIVFYRIFAIIVSLSIAVMYLLSKRDIPLYKLYLVGAILLGVIYCTILPPYSAPDEQFHINEAFTLSSSWMGQLPDEYIALSNSRRFKSNVKRADDNNAVLENYHTSAFSYTALFNGFFGSNEDNTPTVFSGEQVGGFRLLYYPAALGITIARILKLGFSFSLVMGRIFNLACYIALTTLAVKFTPIKKALFAIIGLLPMSMHLAASFSRDCLTIAVYSFFTAYFFYLKLEQKKITLKHLVVIAVVSIFALPAKIVYAPLLLMLLLIPNERIYLRKKKIPEQYVKRAKICLAIVGIAAFILVSLPRLRILFRAPANITESTNPDSIRYTARYVLGHLKDTVWLLLNTIFSNTTFYLNTLIGGRLGYYSIEIDWFFILGFYLLLVLTLIPQKNEKYRLDNMTKKLGIFSSVITSLLVVFACIGWTPTYYLAIYGLQGRYFLPLLPLLLCSVFSGKIPKLQKLSYNQNIDRTLLPIAFTLSSCVALNAFLFIVNT